MRYRTTVIALALAALGCGSAARADVPLPIDASPPHAVPGPQEQAGNPGPPVQGYYDNRGSRERRDRPRDARQYPNGTGHYPYDARRYPYDARRYPYESPQYPGQYPGEWQGYPHYARGGYLPDYYRSQRYWVRDWRARRLAPPPDGYQWVETDTGDILLVALATGLIAMVLLNQ